MNFLFSCFQQILSSFRRLKFEVIWSYSSFQFCMRLKVKNSLKVVYTITNDLMNRLFLLNECSIVQFIFLMYRSISNKVLGVILFYDELLLWIIHQYISRDINQMKFSVILKSFQNVFTWHLRQYDIYNRNLNLTVMTSFI